MTLNQLKNDLNVDYKSYLEERAKDRVLVFAQLYRRLKGQKLSYYDTTNPRKWRHFLIQPMEDYAQDVVWMKGRQVGASEAHINFVLHFLVYHPYTNAIYTFPRDKQLRKFSQTRVDTALDESKFLSNLCPSKNRNVYLKPIGNSNWHLVSAWETNLGEGTPADLVCFDEYDRMKDEVETAFTESLSSSPYGLIRRFSTPTLPMRGVARLYSKSNMYHYYYTCEHCGEKQFLTFDDNVLLVDESKYRPYLEEVDDGAFIIACRKCKKELNRMQQGEWISEYSNKDIMGYYVSQINCPWISADEIVRKRLKYKSEQLFRNYVLGEPYVDSNTGIRREEIMQAIDPNLTMIGGGRGEFDTISVGIDWGNTNWVVVLGLRSDGRIQLINFFWVEDTSEPLGQVKEIANRISVYQPDYIICDVGYGKDRNAQMLHYFPNQTYACQYIVGGFLSRWNEKGHVVKTNRTLSLQNVMSFIRTKRIILPRFDDKLNVLIGHITNLAVVKQEDDETGEIVETVEHMGPADGAHALNYALLPLEQIQRKIESRGDFEFSFVEDPNANVFPANGTMKGWDDLDSYWRNKIDIDLDTM